MNDLITIEAEKRSLATDIRALENDALCRAWDIGRRLGELKARVPHGEWAKTLAEMGVTDRTANRYLSLHSGYPQLASHLGGASLSANSQRTALAVLALDDEELRAKIATNVKVENEELKKAREAVKAARAKEKEVRDEYTRRHADLDKEVEKGVKQRYDADKAYLAKQQRIEATINQSINQAQEELNVVSERSGCALSHSRAIKSAKTAFQTLAVELSDVLDDPNFECPLELVDRWNSLADMFADGAHYIRTTIAKAKQPDVILKRVK